MYSQVPGLIRNLSSIKEALRNALSVGIPNIGVRVLLHSGPGDEAFTFIRQLSLLEFIRNEFFSQGRGLYSITNET